MLLRPGSPIRPHNVAAGTVRVTGLRELDRAFRNLSKDVSKKIRAELLKAAEPVRADAESKAFADISHIGPVWGRIKSGATARMVYIAPATRRTRGGSPRPNLGTLLLEKAMLPALDEKTSAVVAGLELALDDFFDANGW